MQRRGVGRYEDGDGREIIAATAVTVADGRVTTEVLDIASHKMAEICHSTDRRVVWYVASVEAAIRAQAWREREITPDPKPRERKRRVTRDLH